MMICKIPKKAICSNLIVLISISLVLIGYQNCKPLESQKILQDSVSSSMIFPSASNTVAQIEIIEAKVSNGEGHSELHISGTCSIKNGLSAEMEVFLKEDCDSCTPHALTVAFSDCISGIFNITAPLPEVFDEILSGGSDVVVGITLTPRNMDTYEVPDQPIHVSQRLTNSEPPPSTVPLITTNLSTTGTAISGNYYALEVQASSTGNLTYQWYKNNVILDGERTNRFTINSVQPSHKGLYKVRVGLMGSSDYVDSIEHNLTVSSSANPPAARLSIIQNLPESPQVVPYLSSYMMTVTGSGSGVLSYQWYKNDVVIPSATANTLSFSSLDYNDNGRYKVVIGSSTGEKITSNIMELRIPQPKVPTSTIPVLIYSNYPGDRWNEDHTESLLVGGVRIMEVYAIGPGQLTYQWYKNNNIMPGKTEFRLRFDPLQASDFGQYKVRVGLVGAGFVETKTFTLKVVPILSASTLSMTRHLPATKSIFLTEDLQECVDFFSKQPEQVQIQLFKDNNSVFLGSYSYNKRNGTGSVCFDIAYVQASDVGQYKVVLKVGGETVESVMNLTVLSSATTPIITRDTWSLSGKGISPPDEGFLDPPDTYIAIASSETYSFLAEASGAGTLTYQWFKDNLPLSGKNTNTLILARQPSSSGRYNVKISLAGGDTIDSRTVNLHIFPVTNMPILHFQSIVGCYPRQLGEKVDFFIYHLQGDSLYQYQWYKDGNLMSGEGGIGKSVF